MCLGQDDDADLRAVLRAHPDDDAPLVAAIRAAIARKPKGHDFDYSPPDRPRPGRPPHEPHRRLGTAAGCAAAESRYIGTRRAFRPGDRNPEISDLASERASSAAARSDLQRGREAYHRRAWTDAHAILSRIDQETPLGAEDLERLAMSAYLTNRDDDCLRALERCHHAYLDEGSPRRPCAPRSGWASASPADGRRNWARANGWFARGQRLLESVARRLRRTRLPPGAVRRAAARRRRLGGRLRDGDRRGRRSEGASRTPIWSPARCISRGAR